MTEHRMSYRQLIEHAADCYTDCETVEDLRREDPSLIAELVQAYWHENEIDFTEPLADARGPILAAMEVGDSAEMGRIVYRALDEWACRVVETDFRDERERVAERRHDTYYAHNYER